MTKRSIVVNKPYKCVKNISTLNVQLSLILLLLFTIFKVIMINHQQGLEMCQRCFAENHSDIDDTFEQYW